MNVGAEKTFFFLSGLPRSGSTLLGALLTQNPSIYVTPTSPLLDLLCFTERSWAHIQQTRTWPDPHQLPNVYQGMIHSIFRHIERPIIIDKHRGWVKNLRSIGQIFNQRPKVICTVRDITEVMASFLKLVRQARGQGKSNYVDDLLNSKGLSHSDENSCRVLWEHTLSEALLSLKIGFDMDAGCLHLVEYKELISRPVETLRGIYEFLGLEPFDHRFQGIENHAREKDEHWRLDGLHEIRRELRQTSPPPAEILGESLYQEYQSKNSEFWRTFRN